MLEIALGFLLFHLFVAFLHDMTFTRENTD